MQMDMQDQDDTPQGAGTVAPGEGEGDGGGEPRAETNRDRVRRLLFTPLGFRWPTAGPGRVSPEEGRARLDAIADDLAYLPDHILSALADVLRHRGEGAARDFWPSRASILGHADWLHPRPLQLAPALMRWFASVEGPRAIEAGEVVETWAHYERSKAPPVSPMARAAVSDRARENARRLELIADRRERGVRQDPGDLDWEAGYLARRHLCEDFIRSARAGKDGV